MPKNKPYLKGAKKTKALSPTLKGKKALSPTLKAKYKSKSAVHQKMSQILGGF